LRCTGLWKQNQAKQHHYNPMKQPFQVHIPKVNYEEIYGGLLSKSQPAMLSSFHIL